MQRVFDVVDLHGFQRCTYENSWGAILAPSREMLGKIILSVFQEKVTIFSVNYKFKGMIGLLYIH